ncbi:MAG: acetyl-CoA carboxylase biotin carboxyl carrier protein subunit [Holophaga sp.]|nr:acetyl-CoA carboxylase biotin carboxyl carrier protein subunit [Holophaga sp.]
MANNKFTLMLEGSPYEVERRGDLMVVNGVEFTCALKDGQPVIGGTPHPVKLSGTSAEVDGIAYAIEAKGLEEPKGPSKSRKATAGAAEAAGAVTAIMPGLIIKILKKEGERVEIGDTILILEAMKMQNDIQAKVAGTIQQMNVKQGDNVEMRQVLCIIE